MSNDVNTVSTTQQATPFLPQQQHLLGAFDEAARLYNRGDQTPSALRNLNDFYNGDPRLTDIWNRTGAAANQLSGIATGQIGYSPSETMQGFLSGKYLSPESNPWLKGAYEDAAGQVRGQINSQFAGGGRYGSGANQEVLGRNLGQLANSMYGGAYQQGMQNMLSANLLDSQLGAQNIKNQMTAANLYPTVARSFLQDPFMQAQIQQQISDQPWGQLDRFMGTLRGAPSFGSTTTGSTPYFSNPFGQGIGAAGGLLQAANYGKQLFGNPFDWFGGGSAAGFDPAIMDFSAAIDPSSFYGYF